MGCAASTTASAPAQQHSSAAEAAQIQQQPNARPAMPRMPAQPQTNAGNSSSNLKSAPVVRSLVDLSRDRCVIEIGNDGCYVRLTFSSLSAGEIISYFNATEVPEEKSMPEVQASKVSRQQFSPGSSQSARLFLCQDLEADLVQIGEKEKDKHQLVVDLIAESSDPKQITMQRSCLKLGSDHTTAQVTQQRIRCGNVVRTLQALYGTMPAPKAMTNIPTDSSAGLDGEGGECVICLSKPREVVILHCRHVCLCKSCATITSSTWSFQCPVCRGRVAAMVGMTGGSSA